MDSCTCCTVSQFITPKRKEGYMKGDSLNHKNTSKEDDKASK